MKTSTVLFLALAMLVLSALPVQAQVLNPGFEAGTFASWTTTGNCTVVTKLGPPGVVVNPDTGSSMAYLQTQPGSTAAPGLETFAGIAPGAIDALDPVSLPYTQGSVIKQTITVSAGDTLTFRYNFMTQEFPIPNALDNDLAFFSVAGPGGKVVRLANTASPLIPGPSPYDLPGDGMTGFKTFTHTFTASGSVTIAFGVVDMGDMLFGSGLLVDSLVYTPGGPPPATAGVTLSKSTVNVAEGGATDTYTIVLNSAPTANVTISLNSGTQLAVLPSPVVFTPANWNVPQTVTVTAVDDALVEGPHTGTITHTATSTDPAYNAIAVASVTGNITDNDGPPPPPAPPPANPPGEGTYMGSHGDGNHGAHGIPEGTFGFGGGQKLAPPRAPSLLGPFFVGADGRRGSFAFPTGNQPNDTNLCVLNVSSRTSQQTPSNPSAPISIVVSSILVGAALLLIKKAAA